MIRNQNLRTFREWLKNSICRHVCQTGMVINNITGRDLGHSVADMARELHVLVYTKGYTLKQRGLGYLPNPLICLERETGFESE